MERLNYWYIETWEKEIIKVKPDEKNIQYIQKLMSTGDGAVIMPDRAIAVKSIKDFRISDEPYIDQKLIEASSQVFGEPVMTKDGDVVARYVKKSVPRRRWDTFYRYSSSYKIISQESNSVTIVFRLPVHQIDHDKVQELSPDDERKLSKAVD